MESGIKVTKFGPHFPPYEIHIHVSVDMCLIALVLFVLCPSVIKLCKT